MLICEGKCCSKRIRTRQSRDSRCYRPLLIQACRINLPGNIGRPLLLFWSLCLSRFLPDLYRYWVTHHHTKRSVSDLESFLCYGKPPLVHLAKRSFIAAVAACPGSYRTAMSSIPRKQPFWASCYALDIMRNDLDVPSCLKLPAMAIRVTGYNSGDCPI
jgi:hypothetical protein